MSYLQYREEKGEGQGSTRSPPIKSSPSKAHLRTLACISLAIPVEEMAGNIDLSSVQMKLRSATKEEVGNVYWVNIN